MNIEEKANANINTILEKVTEEEKKTIFNFLQLKKEKTSEKATEEEIVTVLYDIGMPEHIRGYRYSVYAIKVVIESPYMMDALIKELYPAVAKRFNTTPSRVERAIRHGIECAWDRCDFEVVKKYFGSTISPSRGKPTNSEFIARIANIVRSRTSNA